MRIKVHAVALLALAVVVVGMAGIAAATPNSNGVVFNLRVFNDNPGSVVTTTNSYPSLVAIEDVGGLSGGFANLHNWRMATGGVEDVFNNGDAFSLCATLTLTGDLHGEAGLQLAPWWSKNVDGRLNVRTTDGEIACFGGRLPFYSFTANQGVHYVKGDAIRLGITYFPNGLSMASPATIKYDLFYNGVPYTSGPLPFDEGNAAEGYGTWGCLNDARLGAHLQAFVAPDPIFATGIRAEWTNICYTNLTPIPDHESSWGKIKSLYSE